MTDAESHSTRYGYDDSGHLTEVILADYRTVNYQSDAAGRLVKYTSPMGDNALAAGRAGPGAQPDGRDGAQDGVRVRRLRASGHAHERERRTLPVPP
nr:RHS repeat domain-containing protein [Escherichia coli]